MGLNRTAKDFVVCIYKKRQDGWLLLRKIYERVPDAEAERGAQIRIIDESGKDGPYPAKYFVSLKLPNHAQKVIESMAKGKLQHG